jgi:anti-sigma28 factor (negative regulator of flagellin synthesis)
MTGKIDADLMRITTTRPAESSRSAKIDRYDTSNTPSAVALSCAGLSFAALERRVAASDGIDHAKVAATSDALREGRYVVDAQRVTEGFLRNEAQWRHAAGMP